MELTKRQQEVLNAMKKGAAYIISGRFYVEGLGSVNYDTFYALIKNNLVHKMKVPSRFGSPVCVYRYGTKEEVKALEEDGFKKEQERKAVEWDKFVCLFHVKLKSRLPLFQFDKEMREVYKEFTSVAPPTLPGE